MLTRYAKSQIPTLYGQFDVVVYRDSETSEEHVAICLGELQGGKDVLVRVHSECWTSEVLGSLKCDCREQFQGALEAISQAKKGVVIYLRQEGRGIGLGNKIRAYALQESGRDTVEANEELGFAPDLRSYEEAATMLSDLGIESVALLTNNPAKIRGLEGAGVKVTRRVSHWLPPNEHNTDYLEVKRQKMGHLPGAFADTSSKRSRTAGTSGGVAPQSREQTDSPTSRPTLQKEPPRSRKKAC